MEKIAEDFDEFVKKISEAERTALNTDEGQKITESLLLMILKEHPDLTVEDWQQVKSEFMTFLFVKMMKEDKALMQELGGHVYDAILKGENNEQ